MSDLCVVFDIDDTLYLERDYVLSAFRAVGIWAERWLAIDGFGEACWAEFDSGRRSTIFNRALASFGIEPTPELISGLVELYRTHEPCIQLAPDGSRMLSEISGRYPIAVVSDGPLASQSRKADALGLRAIASPVILTEIFGHQFCKPHTRAFKEVAAAVSAEHYVYVADNPAKDFIAPCDLGWTTIRVRRFGGLHYSVETLAGAPPDFELPDCSQLADTLARIRR
jgi:putative hydrolase of the HAD superfamily